MGSKKIKTVDLSQQQLKSKTSATTKAKPTSAKSAKTLPSTLQKHPTSPTKDSPTSPDSSLTSATKKSTPKRTRSRRYQDARSQIDRTKTYPLDQALDLIIKITNPNHPTVVADIVCQDEKTQTSLCFPHPTGKTTKVAIADDKLITQIENNQLDFDILLATPDMMPKLAKLAKTLGPKGLMPNPKAGTITKDPQARKKDLESGKITVSTEKKAPLIHIQIGQTTQAHKQLKENLQALIKAINPTNIKKLTISSTMSPGIRVNILELATK